jgi:neutral ceramidase
MGKLSLIAVIAMGTGIPRMATAQSPGAFKAGAAKVDVTPAEKDLPRNYDGILDHLYSRAIVLNNGDASAALISVDAGAIPEEIWRSVTQQIEKQLGIPVANVLLTATHTHSAPAQQSSGYVQKIVDSVKLARERLAPARMGYGTGVSYINVNRNILDPKTKRWWEGANYDGPSDKTVAVIKFESINGDPIAVYYNYAMHAVAAGQLDLVSADAPEPLPSTLKIRLTTRSSRFGPPAPRAIRIRSISSKLSICATSALKTTPSAA